MAETEIEEQRLVVNPESFVGLRMREQIAADQRRADDRRERNQRPIIKPEKFVGVQVRDQLLSQLMVGDRLQRRWADRHRRRNGKILLCIPCIMAEHNRCAQGDCPCPHKHD